MPGVQEWAGVMSFIPQFGSAQNDRQHSFVARLLVATEERRGTVPATGGSHIFERKVLPRGR